MRTLPLTAVFVATLFVTSAALAKEHRSSVQGFGVLGVGSMTTTNANFGGLVTGSLTRNVQIVGEAGRIDNILPSTTQTLISLSPVGFGISAWYGEGGVRVTGGSSGVRPYAETLAGIARLHPEVSGIGSGLPSVIADVGLRFLDRTSPVATVGGGVTFEGGAFVADIGYRHRRVFSDSWMDALALGGSLSTNELRLGIGVRF